MESTNFLRLQMEKIYSTSQVSCFTHLKWLSEFIVFICKKRSLHSQMYLFIYVRNIWCSGRSNLTKFKRYHVENIIRITSVSDLGSFYINWKYAQNENNEPQTVATLKDVLNDAYEFYFSFNARVSNVIIKAANSYVAQAFNSSEA